MLRLRLSLLLVMLAAPSVRAADEVRSYLSGIAEDVARFLKEKRETRVAVSFTGPTTFKTAGGTRLTQILTDELKKKGIEVAAQAPYGFAGTFRPAKHGDVLMDKSGKDKKYDSLRLEIKGKLVDGDDNLVGPREYREVIKEERWLLQAMGLVVDLSGVALGDSRTRRIREALDRPKIHLVGTEARAERTSEFGVEVLRVVKHGEPPQLEPYRPEAKDGLGFVKVSRDDEYFLRLSNQASYEVSALVMVDGINVFHFSEQRSTDPDRTGEPQHRYYVLRPKGQVVVRGWFKHLKNDKITSDTFKVTPYKDSAAARLGKTTDLGMISVTFHASWEEKAGKPPGDEPVVTKLITVVNPETRYIMVKGPDGKMREEALVSATMMTKVATGFGTETSTGGSAVKRTIGQVRSNVTLRYARGDDE